MTVSKHRITSPIALGNAQRRQPMSKFSKAKRDLGVTVPCPRCAALVGVECTNSGGLHGIRVGAAAAARTGREREMQRLAGLRRQKERATGQTDAETADDRL